MKSRILLLVAFASIMAISMIAAATVTEDVMAGKNSNKNSGKNKHGGNGDGTPVSGQTQINNGDDKTDKTKSGQGGGANCC
jgi:hypothetical protein